MELKNKTAVLTGAGSGIGRALALHLAREGCHLALADINTQGLAETARLAAATGVRVSQHRLDVASREAVAALPAEVLAAHGAVDLLINNAGVALGGTFEQVTERDFDWLMDINFNGLVRMTRAFLPLLKARPVARIVNLSSLFGLVAPPEQSAYCASKFAVRGFSNALRHELEDEQSTVGVTVVHPGGVATQIAESARMSEAQTAQEIEQRRKLSRKVLKLSPEKAAAIIVRAVQRDRARVLVGWDAVIVSLVERLMPVRYWRLFARAAKAGVS